MLVAALSMTGIRLDSIDSYRADLKALLSRCRASPAVLPAHSALLLGLNTGALDAGSGFEETLKLYSLNHGAWNEQFLELHAALARELDIYLAAGTLIESEGDFLCHSAYCFDPRGGICCRQKQTHLSAFERSIGLGRGEELKIFPLNGLRAGLVIGNDARHPEVGRIYALRGADLVLSSGALEAGFNCWPQAAGMWAQVQQNQFWAVEAQLSAAIAGTVFGANPAVIGPCEITPGQSGYLARGYPHSPVVTADLDEPARLRIKQKYPLLGLLNPQAYGDLNP